MLKKGDDSIKLNHDLIRNLLLKIEEISDGKNKISYEHLHKNLQNYNGLELSYHLKYLRESNFIQPAGDFHILDITPIGRNYLDNIRNNSIWGNTKAKFQPLESVTFSVITEIAKSLTLKALGL